jgi:hypothetical protein
VSPRGAAFPLRIARTSLSPTGYEVRFESQPGALAYNLYEGEIGSWYGHAPDVCAVPFDDLGSGELRAAFRPSDGGRYYLVTASGDTLEGPSGFDGAGREIAPALSTCAP